MTKPSILSARRIFSHWRQLTNDSIKLCNAFYKEGNFDNRNLILLMNKQASLIPPNLAAQTLLSTYKEANLIKYKGLQQYMKDWYVTASSRKRSDGNVSRENMKEIDFTSTDNSRKKATVAFMITSNQRKTLKDELGYDESAIRKLTPTQATLIIEHKLSYPDNGEDTYLWNKVKRLEIENNKLMEQENSKKMKHIEEEHVIQQNSDINKQVTKKIRPDFHENELAATAAGVKDIEFDKNQKNFTVADKLLSTSNFSDKGKNITHDENDGWFEVIRTKITPEGKTIDVVALYRSYEEAKECAQWKTERMTNSINSSAQDPRDSNNTQSFSIRKR